ncbi:MAG: hypothetical protein GX654_15265 [Desulfatiglans sp.]|jgi:hypothetical protein|nr:hypothetical protein [Desulfatiglans sp.]
MAKENHSNEITAPEADNQCCPTETGSIIGIYKSGCLVCGAPLIYYWKNKESRCCFCGEILQANAGCPVGHFVCDKCHSADVIEIIKNVCLQSRESNMVKLMQAIRSHPLFKMHGPEHHSMVPAVILTALKNRGEQITDDDIVTAIERGKTVCGGACAILGACGAAIGAGIAISIVLKASPNDGGKRQAVQQATQRVLARIASFKAPRCCQRDSWLALKEASAIINEITGKSLPVYSFKCEQLQENRECIHEHCPLWPGIRDSLKGGNPEFYV